MMLLGPDEILSLIILLVTLYILIKAIRYNLKRWKFFSHCEVTRAQVIQKDLKELKKEYSKFDKRSLRFVNSYGKVVVYETRWLARSDKGQELHSDGVEIIYDPDNPTDIRTNRFLLIWFWPLFWLILAFVIFMASLHLNLNNGALDEVIKPFVQYAQSETHCIKVV